MRPGREEAKDKVLVRLRSHRRPSREEWEGSQGRWPLDQVGTVQGGSHQHHHVLLTLSNLRAQNQLWDLIMWRSDVMRDC